MQTEAHYLDEDVHNFGTPSPNLSDDVELAYDRARLLLFGAALSEQRTCRLIRRSKVIVESVVERDHDMSITQCSSIVLKHLQEHIPAGLFSLHLIAG